MLRVYCMRITSVHARDELSPIYVVTFWHALTLERNHYFYTSKTALGRVQERFCSWFTNDQWWMGVQERFCSWLTNDQWWIKKEEWWMVIVFFEILNWKEALMYSKSITKVRLLPFHTHIRIPSQPRCVTESTESVYFTKGKTEFHPKLVV